ncbi:MAG TPA: sigma-70 family RNA polymerase sigma factor [Polyangiaceae bacterium]|nr:sigma-70 family RNA polymerase sigma factor [Polyangiaceae bacterium]
MRLVGAGRPRTPAQQVGEAPSSRPEDSDLKAVIERARGGDSLAFRELFRRYRADVARLVHRMVGSGGDLDDLVQEVFLQVHRSIGDFRGQARFSTWLYRVAVNVVLMQRRAARSRPTFSYVEPATLDDKPLPDEQLARTLRIEAFYRLLDRISEKKRTVFILHELEGLVPADIARIVDAPVLTVRTRLFYARRELAGMMKDEPELCALIHQLESKDGEA